MILEVKSTLPARYYMPIKVIGFLDILFEK